MILIGDLSSNMLSLNYWKGKWETINNQRWMKGRFTEKEDKVIIQKVIEALERNSTDKLDYGFWLSLGIDLDRSINQIQIIWHKVLSKEKRMMLLLRVISKKKSGWLNNTALWCFIFTTHIYLIDNIIYQHPFIHSSIQQWYCHNNGTLYSTVLCTVSCDQTT